MKYKLIVLGLILMVSLPFQSGAQSTVRIIHDFDKGWKFSLGDDSLASQAAYADAKWRKLDLPHDWSIEGNFSESHPATTQGGALPTGTGWYRKTFVAPAEWSRKNVSIEFDGVYCNSEVWINGHYLDKRPYGYSSFNYDLTPHLNRGSVNTIAVRVDNSRQPNSRWYTGSGIYRHVRLVATSPVAVRPWGVAITTSAVSEKKATINIATTINTPHDRRSMVYVSSTVYDKQGKVVARGKSKTHALLAIPGSIRETFVLTNPILWSTENPYLYKVVTRVYENGKLADEYESPLGVRFFHFDKDKGFFLNGQSMKIKGVCNHHDLGALGAAVNTRAMERQLQILKKMGCNAIRTAHNPPAPELLDLCDKMGFLVMDEAFDMWKKKKNKHDYSEDFSQWYKKDLTDMVLRDRNHPSVFMWSIGNEIREQFDSSGISFSREMVALVKELDTTRPVMAALSEWNPEKNFMYKSGAFDVVGLNYHHEVYEDFHKHYPGQIFIGAENMSAFATRGHYDNNSDTVMFWPARSPLKTVEKGNPDFTVSAYDQVSAYWGSTHEKTWGIIKKHPYLSGLFVWSGFDFLGEPIPYPWPARSSYYGIIDLAGFPKDVYYMYQSEWTDEPVLHLFPHWNWKKGQTVDVWAYYNKADEVELFLNGKSLGTKSKPNDTTFHVMWRVPFEPGQLMAVSKKGGKEVLRKIINTTGAPAKLVLLADRDSLLNNGRDLSFIRASLVDAAGNLIPDSDREITFTVKGPGFIAGTDNGYQADTISLKSPVRKTWKGLALAIIGSTEQAGVIEVQATTPGLPPARLLLKNNKKGQKRQPAW
ncbi:DUF4982 domain-containing protein [Nostoc ellipsosporum NOK]|nr:DUF4982 domain-containing protein [Nostoc ellipsosporum NOK]